MYQVIDNENKSFDCKLPAYGVDISRCEVWINSLDAFGIAECVD